MIYFKTCPRCQGDMVLSGDQYGRYMECLQCGYEREVTDTSGRAVPPRETMEKVVAEVS